MKCPVCTDTDLILTERQAVEIDYCPKCRGVWLDRGELDKIIERSMSAIPAASAANYIPTQSYQGEDSRHGHYSSHGNHHGRRKSWLGELFD